MELLVLVSNELTANHFILNKFTGYMISFYSVWYICFIDSQALLILSPSLLCAGSDKHYLCTPPRSLYKRPSLDLRISSVSQ